MEDENGFFFFFNFESDLLVEIDNINRLVRAPEDDRLVEEFTSIHVLFFPAPASIYLVWDFFFLVQTRGLTTLYLRIGVDSYASWGLSSDDDKLEGALTPETKSWFGRWHLRRQACQGSDFELVIWPWRGQAGLGSYLKDDRLVGDLTLKTIGWLGILPWRR